jgi:hypothetical protein
MRKSAVGVILSRGREVSGRDVRAVQVDDKMTVTIRKVGVIRRYPSDLA